MKRNRKKSKFSHEKKVDFPTTEGVIHVHPKGFGFVTSEDLKQYPQDVFIPKHLKADAVDGDKVKISVNTKRKSEKGPEGMVVSVLERGKKELIGIVWMLTEKKDYLLYVQSLKESKFALVKKSEKASYKIGDRLLLHVTSWQEESEPALCSVVGSLGSIDIPIDDIPAAIKEYGINDAFPQHILDEVQTFSDTVEKKDLKDRLDLTQLETFTIDPDTARDFDDALSLSQDSNGNFSLGVHIADVTHYVKQDAMLDIEAKKRCNSTYFPNQCIPMLPETLSNHLCSLKEKVIRLTVSVLMDIDPSGEVLNYKIVKSFIKSRKRFTYKDAKKVLDGEKSSPHLKALKLMEKLCFLFKAKRFKRGSVDLNLPEFLLLINKEGVPYDYEYIEYDITHQLVEEFMLKANELVADYFVKKNIPSIFRVHESPSKENLEAFYALVRILGFPLPDKPSPSDIQKTFEAAKTSPYKRELSIAFVRSMKLAIYSSLNIGHYGLSLENYCHFTSPIRRYSDLIVHRLLFDQTTPFPLDKIAKECSDKERVSFKAEMHVITLKKLRFLKDLYTKDPSKPFDAVISKIKPFGISFEVSPMLLEGFIHISEISDDYYEFFPKNQSLIGKRKRRRFKTGDPIKVVLSKIDLIAMESSWEWLPVVAK